jgi:hypothetical protein
MKIIHSRLRQLENQFGVVDERRRILLVVCHAGCENQDASIQILREGGFLPTGPIGLVNFCAIPAGMNTEEEERFLRERARRSAVADKHGGQSECF